MLISKKINISFRTVTIYKKTIQSVKSKNIFSSMASISTAVKPPNVLVYTAEKAFKHFSESLGKCLFTDKYLVYHLEKEQVQTTPWTENAVLLVAFADDIEENIAKEFEKFVRKGGKLLVVSSKFNVKGVCSYKVMPEKCVNVTYNNKMIANLHQGKYIYSTDNGIDLAYDDERNPIIVEVKIEAGVMILSSICLGLDSFAVFPKLEEKSASNYEASLSILKSLLTENLGLEGFVSNLPAPSSGYVIVEKDTQIEDMMKLMSISEISLEKSVKSPAEIEQASNVRVPLLFHYQGLESTLFDKEVYYSALKTSYFGRTVVFFPVVTSTMHPAEHLSDHPGLVVIAKRQISGKGRGGNMWISPEGSVALTLHFPLTLSSKLGQRMSIMQHIASLAVVHGLRQRIGYEDLEFHLKWPNDIFFERDKKIGGVLVNTTIQGDVVHVYIGIGVNVANSHPTVSVNSVIKDWNEKHGTTLPALKVEEVIAIILNELENLLKDFTESGIAKFSDLYYKYWIHKDQTIILSGSDQKATVKAIDEYGFLIVETEDGKKLSLQPDGNRFDIMKNLVVAKELK